jgi:hypothetical protein
MGEAKESDPVRMRRSQVGVAGLGAAALLLTGCAASSATTGSAEPATSSDSSAPTASAVALPADVRALRTLAEVAPKALKLEGGTVTSTTCWTPSEHLMHDPSATPGTWKVICRVHYDLDGQRRYQDATCIGDFDLTPMLKHCYVWEYYSYEPRYEDGDRLATPAPTPLP